jgi:hypothetical protein
MQKHRKRHPGPGEFARLGSGLEQRGNPSVAIPRPAPSAYSWTGCCVP